MPAGPCDGGPWGGPWGRRAPGDLGSPHPPAPAGPVCGGPAVLASAGQSAASGTRPERRHRNQRTVVRAMASRVASTMTKNPLAIHWATPTASSVLFADRLYIPPATSAATR